ncbi:GPO family capsid scaffolding protein [Cupriavidus sp. UGS-1]|uniref:GPO family capsid scaffolding protein n=1 Tax=Cupriavidus sp. UGS-1 TaxID=2899826 RepID=UPI001E300113|nr:GPO family capsid scaffolding protein [Cupriavidus sp. UGS-1]MCD9124022.1 GPO family capsid scaffolding protein [Cupriavidus sp. UGS-1]
MTKQKKLAVVSLLAIAITLAIVALALPTHAHAAVAAAAILPAFTADNITQALTLGGAIGLAGTVASTGAEKHAESKWFRIATEGATTDDRTITREWIEQMAASYDPKVYGARINLEHFRGILPDGPFKAYGDVLALKAEKGEDGKVALYAKISPTDDLVKMTKARQKVYTSCEIDTEFADTGKAYLVGLAVTDSPASLGTEMLAFSATDQGKNVLAGRKLRPENLFTAAVEVDIELEAEAAPSPIKSLFSNVSALLRKSKGTTDANFSEVVKSVELLASHAKDLTDTVEKLTADNAALVQRMDANEKAHSELVAKLSAEPSGKARPVSPGGTGHVETDC